MDKLLQTQTLLSDNNGNINFYWKIVEEFTSKLVDDSDGYTRRVWISGPLMIAILSLWILASASRASLKYHIRRIQRPTQSPSVEAPAANTPLTLSALLGKISQRFFKDIFLICATLGSSFIVYFCFHYVTARRTSSAKEGDVDSLLNGILFWPSMWSLSSLSAALRSKSDNEVFSSSAFTVINMAGIRVNVPSKYLFYSAIITYVFTELAAAGLKAVICIPIIYAGWMYTSSWSSMNNIQTMRVLLINWSVMSVTFISSFVMFLWVLKNESTNDNAMNDGTATNDWWQHSAVQRIMDWQFYICALTTNSAQVTFAAMCLRFDYNQATVPYEILPEVSFRDDVDTATSSSSLPIPTTVDFAKPYFKRSLLFWILTHIILLTGISFADIHLSTAQYAFISSLAVLPVMLLSVITLALYRGDMRALWRYDETKEVEKDGGCVVKTPWRLDILYIFRNDLKETRGVASGMS